MANYTIPVIVIFGQTGTGKTTLTKTLFSTIPNQIGEQSLSGQAEIVNADSMQVYKGMDIGTAKPEQSLLKALPHHVIDIIHPNQQFGVGEFIKIADKVCADVYSRKKIPVISGGTGFYIKNFLYGLPLTPKAEPKIREKYLEKLKLQGIKPLMDKLIQVDPESAERISIHDEYRIVRALEVYETSGKPLSSFRIPNRLRTQYRFLLISLYRPRKELYERIKSRVFHMMDQGLSDEVKNLVFAGYSAKDPGMKGIGYKEFFDPQGNFLKTNIEHIRSQIISNTCKYAKRQETFIRPISGFSRIHADDYEKILSKIKEFLKT